MESFYRDINLSKNTTTNHVFKLVDAPIEIDKMKRTMVGNDGLNPGIYKTLNFD